MVHVNALAQQSWTSGSISWLAWLESVVLDNSMRAWLTAIGIALLIPALFGLVRGVVLRRMKRIASKTQTRADDLVYALVRDIRSWLVILVGLYIGQLGLVLDERIHGVIRWLAVGAVAVQLIISSRLVVDYALSRIARGSRGEDGAPDATVSSSLGVVRFLVMVTLGLAIILLALDNLGIKVTPLLTGLGIGGIAVALAVQNVLGDVFASLSIVLDKPFVVGDFIVVDDKKGTVERIGIKTTRLRALSGEQLVFSNSELLAARLHNFRRMQERRMVFAVGVIYETPVALVREIPAILRGAIESVEKTRFDRCHFKSFGAYSLDYEAVYFVLGPDYNLSMDIQQAVNLAIMERFAEKGIEFAYPTQLEIVRDEGASAGKVLRARGG
jgi:small-conductance mechanosensitive channel